MDLDRYTVTGEVMPQSYVSPSPDYWPAQKMTHAANLSIHALKELARYDRERAGVTDDAPWLSQAAAILGADLFMYDRYMIGNFVKGR
jgi:hypothetical protein